MSLTAQRLRDELSYDPVTGIFRRRHDQRGRGFPYKAGDIAGGVAGNGYYFIRVDGVKYTGHRLAWFYVHGAWPSLEVDHKNRIRRDNRIDNLRLATGSDNCRNGPIRNTNTSGFKGVSFRAKHSRRPWRATIYLNGKQVELGFFASPEEAAAVRRAAATHHFGEFATEENGMIRGDKDER